MSRQLASARFIPSAGSTHTAIFMKPSDKADTDLRHTYDRIAKRYADQYFHELADKPFDRELLDRFAGVVHDRGKVCEIGCGPGQIARYLKDRDVDIFGVDLSPEMVSTAGELNPDIDFEEGNMLHLNASDNAWAGIVAFYSIIHLSRHEIVTAFREFFRVLQSDGRLMLAFHRGEGEVRTDNWFGEPVSVAATLFETDEVVLALERTGFFVEGTLERPPYDCEYQSRRVYVFAEKP